LPDDPLLLIDEVATLTRRSVNTLRWLHHRGGGPPAGRRIYYRKSGVLKWLTEQGCGFQ
jgi:hypothetical protein